MKIFQCGNCHFPVFFENTYCGQCGSSLGFLDEHFQLYALNPNHPDWQIKNRSYQYCKNQAHQACNWLVPLDDLSGFCTSCTLNRTIPDLTYSENFEKWITLEEAKRKLVYSLLKLSLPVKSKLTEPESGLCFDFLSDKVLDASGQKIMTGHDDGVITIVLSEADSVNREQIRKSLNEPYRTLIGHFRHEVGHYYWKLLIHQNHSLLAKFREVFGDERQNYGEALQTHYREGAPSDWRNRFISEYASSHPWEDWAETWAHYLHIMDTMETAYYFGLSGDPKLSKGQHMQIQSVDPYSNISFSSILDNTTPLFYAVNSINRSMGIPDVYPFVISEPVKKKMEFIHEICTST